MTLSGATPGVTQFALTYNGVSTAPITYSTTDAATVQAALNALPTIGGIASVTVIQTGSVFSITFGGSLGGMEIPTLTASVTNGAGASIAVGQVQTVSLNGAAAGTTKFTMTYNGATTPALTYTAASAAAVQAALDALSTIGGIGGTATVTQTGATFFVTFGGSLSGPGIPILTATITTAPGTVVLGQVQTVNLTGALANTTEFTLSFNGVSTAPIIYTTTDGPTVQAALNALSSIGGVGGSVTVTQVGSTFTVTFGGSLTGPNIAELNAAIFTSAVVGTAVGTTPVGFKVPNELLTLNGFGEAGVNVAPRNMATRTGGPAPAAEVTGALNNQAGDNAWEMPITFWSTLAELTNSNQSGYYEPAITIGRRAGNKPDHRRRHGRQRDRLDHQLLVQQGRPGARHPDGCQHVHVRRGHPARRPERARLTGPGPGHEPGKNGLVGHQSRIAGGRDSRFVRSGRNLQFVFPHRNRHRSERPRLEQRRYALDNISGQNIRRQMCSCKQRWGPPTSAWRRTPTRRTCRGRPGTISASSRSMARSWEWGRAPPWRP